MVLLGFVGKEPILQRLAEIGRIGNWEFEA
jgi:hypothetical protein